jgi:hypothetical protein
MNVRLSALLRTLQSSRIHRIQSRIVRLWHKRENHIQNWEDACREIPLPREPLLGLAAAIARINAYQWHQEDQARDTAASDALIVQIKRCIDQSNQRRVEAIETFDSSLERILHAAQAVGDQRLPLSSETPGSLVDRLSILELKIYHMAEQTRRKDINAMQRRSFAAKLEVLREQSSDLGSCLDDLLRDVCAKRRRFKTYFQFKMYNEAETNPYLRAQRPLTRIS